MRLLLSISVFLFVGIMQVIAQCSITVQCRPKPAIVECSCDIGDINPIFLDFESDNNEDIIAFEALGFSVSSTGNCGNLRVTANDIENHPTSCAEAFFVERIYQIVSINGGAAQTCIDTFETEFIPPNFLTNAVDTVKVSCEENVDSLFQATKDTFFFATFLDCYPETSAQYFPDVNPVLATNCGADQFVRPLLRLRGPCSNKCDGLMMADRDQTISTFVARDTVQAVLTCPISPNPLDVSDPELDDKIRDLLEAVTLDFSCLEPIVSNDFVFDSLDLTACIPEDLTVTVLATEGCTDNSSSCTFVVDLENAIVPEIDFIPDTLFLTCGNPNNFDLTIAWLRMAQATDSRGMVINLNNTPSNINNITHSFDLNNLDQATCSQAFPVNFIAFDNCSLSASGRGVIMIEDSELPIIINCPQDTVVNADDPDIMINVNTWLSGFSGEDNCNPNVLLSNDFDNALLGFNCGSVDTLVTFIANDNCNTPDSTACQATLSILDNVMDLFVNLPNDTTFQCQNPINTQAIGAWAAGASGANTLGRTFLVESDLDFLDPLFTTCDAVIDVTFSFVNQCGVERDTTATITIIDTEDPTITCPAPITLEGDITDLLTPITDWLGTAIPQDNCGVGTQNDYSSFLFNDCDSDTIPADITFFALDDCGNRSQNCTAELTIISEKSPIIICPPTLLVECGTPGITDSINNWLTFDGSNFAGTPIAATNDLIIGTLNFTTCGEDTPVLFTVEDTDCQRTETCTSNIRIQDLTPPTVDCPINLTVSTTDVLAQATIDAWVAGVIAEDSGCSTPTLFSDPDVSGIDFCMASAPINVTFTAIDMCNQQFGCVSIITFDNSAPTITCPQNDLDLECVDSDNDSNIQAWLQETSAADNATADLSAMVMNDFSTTLVDTCFQVIPVTFTVTDNCGTESTCSQDIRIQDTTAPVVDCPIAPLNLLGGDTLKIPKYDAWVALIPVLECTGTTITDDFDETQIEGFNCDEEQFNVNLSFTDDCGLITPCQVEINVQNNIQTTFINCDSGINDFTVECGNPNYEDEIRQWMSAVSAEDVFGSSFPTTPDLDFNDPALFQCSSIIPVLFELVDLCGNSQSCSLDLRVIDTERPIPSCPQDTSFIIEDPDFDTNVTQWLDLASGTDNCIDNLMRQSNYSPISSLPMCTPSLDIPVEFTILDGCGNNASCESILTVTTERVPSIGCPQDIVVECGDTDNQQTITSIFDNIIGTDADGGPLAPQFTFDMSELDAIDCDGIIPVLFTIEDNCNIQDTCSVNIIVEDTTPPVAICPPALTINSTDPAGSIMMQDWIDSFQPTDNCSTPMASIENGVIVPAAFCLSIEEMEIEFYAEDACAMRDTCTAMLTINKDAPTIICPNNLALQCGDSDNDQQIQDWLLNVTATDNNGLDLQSSDTFMQANFNNGCTQDIPVTFTATDNCRIPSSCTVMISQVDTLAPIVTNCPPSLNLEIGEDDIPLSIANWRAGFQAMDMCNTASITDNYDNVIETMDCGDVQDVMYTAVDECGNENTDCIATVSISNNLQVSIDCPEPIQLKCNEASTMNDILVFLTEFTPFSEDDFSVTNDLDIETIDLECAAPFVQDVTLTIIDDCGNTNDCTTSIELIPAANIYIPTIFDPAASDDNNRFTIGVNIAIQEIESMRIYSRWGDLMFERENFDPRVELGWSGRDRFGRFAPGVYTYVIVFQDIFGNPFEQIGTITLI